MRLPCLLLIAGLVGAGSAQAQTQAPAQAPTPAPAPAPTPAPAQAPTQAPTQAPGWEATVKAVTEACKGQTPQLCPGLTGETALACLQSNYDKLTPTCKDSVMKAAKAALNSL